MPAITKLISGRVHGVLDYATVAAFLNAPMVFGFQGTTAAAIVYWLAGIHLLMTGCTDFPLGVFKWIPFKIHGAIELVAGIRRAVDIRLLRGVSSTKFFCCAGDRRLRGRSTHGLLAARRASAASTR